MTNSNTLTIEQLEALNAKADGILEIITNALEYEGTSSSSSCTAAGHIRI